MSDRYALPRRESMWDMTAEDLARIEAINARLKPLAEDAVSRPVVISYWRDSDMRLLTRTVIASPFLPSATQLIPAPLDDWAGQATHITIETAGVSRPEPRCAHTSPLGWCKLRANHPEGPMFDFFTDYNGHMYDDAPPEPAVPAA